jgi:uncharacterized protein (DUF2267 family)
MAIRDRVPPEEAVHFAAQLPMLVRGFYYENWVPSQTPLKYHQLQDFYSMVSLNAGDVPYVAQDTQKVTKAVFKVLHKHIGEEALKKIKSGFPEQIGILWKDIGL